MSSENIRTGCDSAARPDERTLRAHSLLCSDTRIIPIAPERCVKSVRKLANGDFEVTQHSGNIFTVSAHEPLLQAFVIYSVLAER